MRAVIVLKIFAGKTIPKGKNILFFLVVIFLLFSQLSPTAFAYTNQFPDNWSQTQYEKYLKPYENSYPAANNVPATSPTPTPTPTPTYVAKNDSERQQLALINQLHNNQLSNTQVFFLYLTMFLPLPIATRLAMYHFLNTLPISNLSPATIILFVLLGPIPSLLFLYFAIRSLIRISKSVLPFVLKRFRKSEEEKKFLELTFPSDTSKSAFATEQLYKLIHTLSQKNHGFFSQAHSYSLEIVATKDTGIRYVIGVPKTDADVLHRSLLAYLPGLQVKEVSDYLSKISILTNTKEAGKEEANTENETETNCVIELKLSQDFALPLQDQKVLSQHDPISYLAGNMTKLKKGELIAFQIVASPAISTKVKNRMQEIQNTIYQGKPLSPVLNKKRLLPFPSTVLLILSPLLWLIVFVSRLAVKLPYLVFAPNSPQAKDFFNSQPKVPLQILLNPYEQELATVVKEKLNQHLFETSIRLIIVTNDPEEFVARETGLVSSFGQYASPYQSLITKNMTRIPIFAASSFKKRWLNFKERNLSRNTVVLSSSELSDLYHFPNMDITKIEGLVKSKSPELPAPLSIRRAEAKLDVIVGMNTYGGEQTPVGLAQEQRKQHMYIIGKTGMGKSTIIEGMSLQDIENGKGVCVIDPHGDMVEHLLTLIPEHRQKDIIYINPADKAYPTGLNIMSPQITYQDSEEAQGAIARSVIDIFMKITPERHWGQRMEHILRNAVFTVLQTPTQTPETPYISLYAVQKLLTDEDYRKTVTGTIADPVLKQFWKKEFSLFKKQQGELIGPLTNKIGEFITDKLSRYMLLQEKSTINISEIMDEGKILLVNVSKGKLSEERSAFFGTVITSLIQLAVGERAQTPEIDRQDFYVYIDEFQNFATPHFTELFSEARKYHVYFIASHQNIAQIDDPKVSKIIQGNAGTYVALKGSHDDEKAILPLFEPEVEKGQIVNLAPYHFFMKVTNAESEDAFTGVSIQVTQKGNAQTARKIIEHSQKQYATPKEEVGTQLEQLFKTAPTKRTKKETSQEAKFTPIPKTNGIKNGAQPIKQQLA